MRLSRRSRDALVWELDLLDALDAVGVVVPRSVVTNDGRRHDGGVLVQRFIHGAPPRDRADWERVVSTLEVVHEVTSGWPQRPGFASARALLSQPAGGYVDLEKMPPGAAALIRASWRPAFSGGECAIHGDLGHRNVLITDQKVALIDWDESRVDDPAFDFAHVPSDVAVPVKCDRTTLLMAGVAWDAATCWVVEPDYAARRLVKLRELARRRP